MEITLKIASQEDAAAFCLLNREFNGEDGTSTEEQAARSLAENPLETVLLAFVDGIPAGFACAQIHRSACYPLAPAEITEFYVRETFRRRKIGSRMIAEIQRIFREQGISELLLVTGQQNLSAQAFYESCGYRRTNHFIYLKELLHEL